jgi:hypothetical protein
MPPLSATADHNIIYVDMLIKPEVGKQPKRKAYMYHKANWDKIKESTTLLSNNLLTVEPTKTTQELWDAIESGLQDIVKDNIPSKPIKGYKDPPWLTGEIKTLFRKRDTAYRRWVRSCSHQDEMAFKSIKTESQNKWRQARDKYTQSIFSSENDDDYEHHVHRQPLKKFWGYIKALKRDNSGTSPLKKDGVLITDAKGKANIMNDQYASVFTKEDTASVPNLGPCPNKKIQPLEISPKGVELLLSGLNPSKAAGPDSLHPRFLKEVSKELTPLLARLFQKSLEEGSVPVQWRTANVTPIFKKGERYVPANYRPVSLTAVICKTLEHIIARHIMYHLESEGLLADSQHGFRANRSCETQILNFTSEMTEGIAKGKQYDANVMDFSKAFDRVPHRRLLRKAEYCGIQGPILHWVSSFLSDRKQRVLIDGAHSDVRDVISGVPQGTVLGPVLFLIFINDLPGHISSSCKLFADDLVVYREIKDSQDAELLQKDMDSLAQWETKWGMKFNLDKCESISLTRKRHPLSTT